MIASVHDSRRRALLTAAVGFALLPVRHDQPEVGVLRRWLDTWTGLGLVTVGMARQGYDLLLTRYAEQGWRANFYPAGIAHSVVRVPEILIPPFPEILVGPGRL